MTTPKASEENTEQRSPFRLPIQKNSLILAIFAIVCTAIVGLVNELTKDKIKVQEQLQLLNTLHSIIEPARYNNDITQDCVNFQSPLLGNSKTTSHKAYVARYNTETVAMAMTSTAPDGYNGKIELIIAINIDNSITKFVASGLFGEWDVNTLGYEYLMQLNKPKIALCIFKTNTILFPNSPNVFDSYGEALKANGDMNSSIESYHKAVDIAIKTNSRDLDYYKENLQKVKDDMEHNK